MTTLTPTLGKYVRTRDLPPNHPVSDGAEGVVQGILYDTRPVFSVNFGPPWGCHRMPLSWLECIPSDPWTVVDVTTKLALTAPRRYQ